MVSKVMYLRIKYLICWFDCGVNHSPTGRIDQISALFHHSQTVCIDQMTGFGGQRTVKGNDVGLGQKFFQRHEINKGRFLAGQMAFIAQHPAAKSLAQFGRACSDGSCTDDSHSLAAQFTADPMSARLSLLTRVSVSMTSAVGCSSMVVLICLRRNTN